MWNTEYSAGFFLVMQIYREANKISERIIDFFQKENRRTKNKKWKEILHTPFFVKHRAI